MWLRLQTNTFSLFGRTDSLFILVHSWFGKRELTKRHSWRPVKQKSETKFGWIELAHSIRHFENRTGKWADFFLISVHGLQLTAYAPSNTTLSRWFGCPYLALSKESPSMFCCFFLAFPRVLWGFVGFAETKSLIGNSWEGAKCRETTNQSRKGRTEAHSSAAKMESHCSRANHNENKLINQFCNCSGYSGGIVFVFSFQIRKPSVPITATSQNPRKFAKQNDFQ